MILLVKWYNRGLRYVFFIPTLFISTQPKPVHTFLISLRRQISILFQLLRKITKVALKIWLFATQKNRSFVLKWVIKTYTLLLLLMYFVSFYRYNNENLPCGTLPLWNQHVKYNKISFDASSQFQHNYIVLLITRLSASFHVICRAYKDVSKSFFQTNTIQLNMLGFGKTYKFSFIFSYLA